MKLKIPKGCLLLRTSLKTPFNPTALNSTTLNQHDRDQSERGIACTPFGQPIGARARNHVTNVFLMSDVVLTSFVRDSVSVKSSNLLLVLVILNSSPSAVTVSLLASDIITRRRNISADFSTRWYVCLCCFRPLHDVS